MITIDIITLFPEMFTGPFGASIIKRAQEKKIADIRLANLRRWSGDKRGTVDDRTYGGGPGMILMVEPVDKALAELRTKESFVVLTDPSGKKYTQTVARRFSLLKHLIIICGHYEGVDQRIKDYLVDECLSIGDFILTGGEIAAMAITDSLIRLRPGVLGKDAAVKDESFTDGLLEYPQYTRPEVYRGWPVPPILLSGNHGQIDQWRREKAVELTRKVRPDLP
jgi:tRNA (guanine37-N1)-methyltransferase